MKLLLSFFTLLLSATAFSKETYQFIFPESNNSPHVKLQGTIDRPLTEYTLCHWSKVNGNLAWGTIFSYNTPELYRAIGTWINNDGLFYLEQNNVGLLASLIEKDILLWLHVCVTSSVLRGKNTVYFNGVRRWTGENKNQTKPIPPHGRVVLGQDNLITNEFQLGHDFIGHIADLFLWDRSLNSQEVAAVYACKLPDEANVINWNLHAWQLFNGVSVSKVTLPCGFKM